LLIIEEMTNSTAATLIRTVARLSKVSFSWYDYILFSVMLVFSALIGIYFGCFGSKQSTANEYLMGGKTMKVIPIAISLVARYNWYCPIVSTLTSLVVATLPESLFWLYPPTSTATEPATGWEASRWPFSAS
jgi:hypothetical protein